mgnify:CR=1 FL=1
MYTAATTPYTDEDIVARAAATFGVHLPPAAAIRFVRVPATRLLDAALYPRFTMVGQSLGSMVAAWQALRAYTPAVFVDTTGAAFTFVVAKLLAGCAVGAYVHYPTITTEMVSAVAEQRPSHNNDGAVAASAAATRAKLAYYAAFAAAYRLTGGLADTVAVNSRWTKGHIDALWRLPAAGGDLFEPAPSVAASLARALGCAGRRPAAVTMYPPCNTAALAALPLGGRDRVIVSIGQFRPEKDHALQLRAFAAFRSRSPDYADVRLQLVGGARDEGDRQRVAALRSLAADLGIADAVEFAVNVSLEDLKARYGRAAVGVHTMWNEHFGIGVVEMMAAGLVTVAHASGGPRADIVNQDGASTGFLATSVAEYADAFEAVFAGRVDTHAMTAAARASVARFSDAAFAATFLATFAPILRAAGAAHVAPPPAT